MCHWAIETAAGFSIDNHTIAQSLNLVSMMIEIILEAWIALKRNRTRSLLTMLGIVWGIAT